MSPTTTPVAGCRFVGFRRWGFIHGQVGECHFAFGEGNLGGKRAPPLVVCNEVCARDGGRHASGAAVVPPS